MRITVIGGTGHIGTYLVPKLVELGHAVTMVSRGKREPYHPDPAWNSVKTLNIDRSRAEKEGIFGRQIANTKADAVLDLLCFTEKSCRELTAALREMTGHLLHCGSLWVFGHSAVVPASEEEPKTPICEYGKEKLAIEKYLLGEAGAKGFPATVLHPGHISGPGWIPINPAGHISLNVFERLAGGEELLLPNFGMETLHHVHAADVAQAFIKALINRPAALGESFNVASPAALTMRGYAEAVAAHFGREANLKFAPFAEWEKSETQEAAGITLDHMLHSPNASIEKAVKELGYEPKYSSLETIFEALGWLIENGKIRIKREAL